MQGVSTGASTPSSIGRIVSKAVIIAVAVNTDGVREVLGSTWQRCRVYFLRNALAHADKGQRQMVLAAINTAFAQESFETATERWRVVADQLRVKFPALAQLMDVAEADVLAFMSFPKAHRARIHSTSLLERLNAEIKRRTNVVGIFPNAGVVTRLVGAHCSNGTTSGS